MRKKTHLFIILILFEALCFSSYAQCVYNKKYLDLDVLGVDQGVSAGLVYQVTQDTKGYLWLATTQGLNRYDGYTIKEYVHITGDSLSLPENHIIAVHVDKRGNLWVGLLNKGVYLFDQSNETFHKIDADIFSRFHEDNNGNIWVDYQDGKWNVIALNQKNTKEYQFPSLNKIQVTPAHVAYRGLPKQMSSLSFSSNNFVNWVIKDTLYSYSIDYESRTSKSNFIKKVNRKVYSEDRRYSPIVDNPYNKEEIIVFLNESYLLISLKDGSILYENCIPDEIINIKLTPRLVDNKKRIWLFGDQKNECLFDFKKNEFSLVKKSGIESIDENWQTLCAYPFQDKDDNIWMPSKGYGVYKYNTKRERFNYYGQNNIGPSIPPLIYVPPNSIIFNDMQGLKQYSTQEKKIIKIWDDSLSKKVDEIKTFNAAYLSPKNVLWFHYEENDKEYLVKLNAKGNFEKKIPWDTDYHIFCKRELIFTEEEACWEVAAPIDKNMVLDYPFLTLKHWNLSTGKKVEYAFTEASDAFTFGSLRTWSLIENTLYLGFSERGVVTFDTKNKKWRHFIHKEQETNSLSSNRVLSFCKDPMFPDSILWIGTSIGLNRFNIVTLDFEHFSTKNGFPNNVIYGILPDYKNNLWLSTNYGLSLFDYSNQKVRNFTKIDGLQHNEFNKGAFAKSQEGILYFGGVGGLTWFDPHVFYSVAESSKVVINELRLDNEFIKLNRNSISSNAVNLNKPIEYTSTLTLDHTNRMVSFNFACLDLSKPQSNKFKYKLEGFNDNWIEAKNAHEATYTNLPSGNYVFKVIGCNSEDVWSEHPATLQLTVLPPWWQTWWFRVLMLLLIMLIMYSIYQNRRRELERIQNLRNQISKDLHDEIGSTLSSISLFCTVAERKINKDVSATQRMLVKMNEKSTQVMESMNDIVWAINSDNDKVENVISRMRAYSSELADASVIRVSFIIDPDILNVNLNMVQRRNLYLIYKEALNNAFKYSSARQIAVGLSNRDGKLQLEIEDDGIGFNDEVTSNTTTLGGNGLKNMQSRASELKGNLIITSKEGEGTKIIFSWNPK